MNKKIKCLSIAALSFSLVTIGYATEGFYLGAAVGQTNTHNAPLNVQTGTVPATVLTTPNNTGMGERLFAGYNINQYAAFEGGFIHYADSTYKPSITTSCGGNPTIRTNSFDIEGKGMFPIIPNAVNLFAKGGLAIITASQSGSLAPLPTGGPCDGKNQNTTKVRPMIGVGASYDFSQNWVGELGFSRVMSGSGIPNADFIGLGISYHFVDKMCGQFLC